MHLRSAEAALSRFKEIHRTAGNDVCLIQFMDDAWQNDWNAGMNAPITGTKALQDTKASHVGIGNGQISEVFS